MSEQQSSLPLIDLPNGAQIVLEAISPTTGAQITGVTVANVAITYQDNAAPGGGEPVGPFMLVPGEAA